MSNLNLHNVDTNARLGTAKPPSRKSWMAPGRRSSGESRKAPSSARHNSRQSTCEPFSRNDRRRVDLPPGGHQGSPEAKCCSSHPGAQPPRGSRRTAPGRRADCAPTARRADPRAYPDPRSLDHRRRRHRQPGGEAAPMNLRCCSRYSHASFRGEAGFIPILAGVRPLCGLPSWVRQRPDRAC